MPTAYFDFDDTIIHGDSILYWNRFLFRKAPVLRLFFPLQWLALLLWILRIFDTAQYKLWLLLPSSYISQDQRQAWAREFAQNELPQYAHPLIMAKLRSHIEQGDKIVIVSASGDFYLREICSWTNAREIIGTTIYFPIKKWWRLPYYQNGNFKGVAKIEFLNQDPERFPQKDSYAYSDHHSDHFLLQWAEKAICVGPTKKLRDLALANEWPILELQNQNCFKKKWDRLKRLGLLLFSWL